MVDTLEPGTVIHPIIDEEEAKLLAERLYGISVLELTPLDGYNDKNYRVTEDPNMKNPLIITPSEHGYVLKIMNSMDSKNVAAIRAQNEVMNFLGTRGISCPKPIRNVYGHFYSLETIQGKSHVVRLLEYVPGQQLEKVPRSDALLYQVGEFAANLDNMLQNFNPSELMTHEHIWMLTRVPDLKKFTYVIKEQEKLDLVEEVIEEFKREVVPRLDELEKGVIYGDVNETNTLVGPKPGGSNGEYCVTGIIDFSDIQYSYYVFEVAIAMTHLILNYGDVSAGGLVLAGYSGNKRLPDDEYRLLKILISSRLVQILVLGAYTREQDPSNAYVAATESVKDWELLKKIRKTKPAGEADPCDWKSIAKEYLTRS